MTELTIKFSTKKKSLKIKMTHGDGEVVKFKCDVDAFGSNELSKAFSIVEILRKK